MKKLLYLALALLLLWTLGVQAQPLPMKSWTLQTAASSGNGSPFQLGGYSSVLVILAGSAGADRVVTFQGSGLKDLDVDYTSISCTRVDAPTTAATTATISSTTIQQWNCPVIGVKYFRTPVSAGTTGTVTVTANAQAGVTLNNGGGSSSSTSVAGPVYLPTSYGALCDNSTDDSTAVQAAINAAAAANGGKVEFPSGTCIIASQLTIPSSGSPAAQKSIRLTGQGPGKSNQGNVPLGGTILKLTYSGAGSKISTTARGYLEIDNMTLQETGASTTTTFIGATGTQVYLHDLEIFGSSTKSGALCDQDAILLGSTFTGYGSVIERVQFDRIRRALYCRTACNAVVFQNNNIQVNTGSNLTTQVTAASNAAAAILTVSGHGFPIGTTLSITFSGATGNWTPLNATLVATILTANTFSVPVNSTTFGALTGTVVFNSGAAIEIAGTDTSTNGAKGNIVANNLIETTGYGYGALASNGADNVFVFNGIYDSSLGTTLAGFRFESTSTTNTVISGRRAAGLVSPMVIDVSGTATINDGTSGGKYVLGNLSSNGFVQTSGGNGLLGIIADPLAETHGGTNQSTYTQGDLLYASAANTLSKLAKDANSTRYLSNTGASNAPAWAQVGLTTGVTGTLPVGNGGTGTATAFTQGSVVFAGASGVYSQDNAQIFWDDTAHCLAIGTNTCTAPIRVISQSTAGVGSLEQYSANAAGAVVRGEKFRGTLAAPLRAKLNDTLVSLTGVGGFAADDVSAASVGSDVAQVRSRAAEDYTSTNQGSYLEFRTTPIGSVTIATPMILSSAGVLALSGTTDATSTTTGTLTNAGGMSVNKRVFMNGLTTSAGTQTAVICQSSGGELIADSVACIASSRNYKEDISSIERNALSLVEELRPVSFRYKPEGIFASNPHPLRYGFIAEEVERIDKKLVGYDNKGEVRTVDMMGLVPLLVKAIQEQQREIESLKAAIGK